MPAAASLVGDHSGFTRSRGLVQCSCQALEVAVEGDKAGRSLKEGFSTCVIGQTIKLILSVAGSQPASAR